MPKLLDRPIAEYIEIIGVPSGLVVLVSIEFEILAIQVSTLNVLKHHSSSYRVSDHQANDTDVAE